MNKSEDAFRTIGEVADELDVPKHVLRFWESKFPQIRPMKRGGGRRYYRPEDMELLRGIRHLLHAEGYTIKGVQKILREHGIDQVKATVKASMDAAAAAGAVKKRGRRQLTPAPVSPLKAAAAPAGRDGASLPERSQKDIIAAAIRELLACRALLTAASAASPVAPAEKRTRASRS
jgi:DNA-binding transcriptional MerR regulator